MAIHITINDFEQSKKAIEDLIQAFYDSPVSFVWNQVDTPVDLAITIERGLTNDQPWIRSVAHWLKTDDQREASDQLQVNDPDPWATIERRTILRSVLMVMETWTGWTMPWGVLTGVRPTKRMHHLLDHMDDASALALLSKRDALKPHKVKQVHHIAKLQRDVFPNWHALDQEISLYIGIPFCPTKCAYCTFPAYDIRGQQGSVDAFLDALVKEIIGLGRFLREHPIAITTIYWGGGTPTSITAEQLDELFTVLHREIPGVQNVREITVEAGRPDTITPEKLEVLKKWGVHRISVNPQSFTQETLDQIGRHHTVEETVAAMSLSRSHGMDNINMDLIIGLPDEQLEHVQHSLKQIEPWQPESLTVHTLSFKRASNMTQSRNEYQVASRHEIHRMFDVSEKWTASNGYEAYYLYRQKNILGNLENVGYAKPGKSCLYNILMMEEIQTIIGLGCGAVSRFVWPSGTTRPDGKQSVERLANPKDPRSYVLQIEEDMHKKHRLIQEFLFSYTSV